MQFLQIFSGLLFTIFFLYNFKNPKLRNKVFPAVSISGGFCETHYTFPFPYCSHTPQVCLKGYRTQLSHTPHIFHSQPPQELKFRYCVFPSAFKINPHLQPWRLSAATKKTLQCFDDPGCTYAKSILPLEQSCPTDNTGSVVAEGKLCWQRWSLYRHRSTVHFFVHVRPLLQMASQASRGKPSLLLFHICDQQQRPLSMPQQRTVPVEALWLCGLQLEGLLWPETMYFPFASHIWMGRKSCFRRKEHIGFRSINHKI